MSTLWQPIPSLFEFDKTYFSIANSENLSKCPNCFSRICTSAYFQYLFFVQFRLGVFLAKCRATFPSCIHHVIFLASNKHVIRSNTKRIVSTWTVMAKVHSIWDWTKFEFPCKTVSRMRFIHKIKNGISISFWTVPQPARIGFRDMPPKANNWITLWATFLTYIPTFFGTELMFAPRNSAWFLIEASLARLAFYHHKHNVPETC